MYSRMHWYEIINIQCEHSIICENKLNMDKYLQYDPKLEMKHILDNMSYVKLCFIWHWHAIFVLKKIVIVVWKKYYSEQQLLNEQLYCVHVTKCINYIVYMLQNVFANALIWNH